MAESVQVFDKLWISSDDSTYTALEFLEGSGIGAVETFADSNGIRGTRQHSAERVRRTQRMVQGTLNFAPASGEIDLLIPWILGGTTLQETLLSRYLITGRDGVYHKYNGLKVNRATFSAAEGSPLNVSLDVMGVDEASGASKADAISDDNGPFVLSDCTLTVGGTQYGFRSMQITIDNALETKFNNSVTPSSIHATDLACGVTLTLPYGDASALYGSALGGVTVVAAFANTTTLTITLAGVAAPKQPLGFGGRGARDLVWTGVARRTGSTAPIAITNA